MIDDQNIPRRRMHSSRLLPIAISLIVLCAGYGSAVATTTAHLSADAQERTTVTTDMSTQPASATEATDGAVDPLAIIPIGAPAAGGVVTDDAVWAISGAGVLFRIDPATNEIVDEIPIPGPAYRFDIGHGAAWVTDFDAGVVRRIDLETGAVIAEIVTGLGPEGVDVTDDAVWIADHHGGTVTRIDPATNLVVATVTVGPSGPAGPQPVVVDGDLVWTGVPNIGQIVGIDASTNEVVANVDVPVFPCGEIQVIDDSVWVTSCFEDDIVNVIDTESATLRGSVDVGGFAGTPLPVANIVWFPTVSGEPDEPGRIVGIDASTLEIVDTVTVDQPAYAAGLGFDSVWLFSFDAEAVIRLPLDAFRTPAERRPRAGSEPRR